MSDLDTPGTTPTEPADGDAGPEGLSSRARAWRVAGVAGMLVIALFWIWIFSGAAREQNPDRLDDRAWVERAEATCATTQATIDARTAGAGTQSRAARADDIDASTEDLRAMLAALADPLPEGASDREVVSRWLDDWDRLLDDRDAYADAVRVNPDARYLTEEKFDDPLDRVVETFADVNDMPSCAPAGDVG